MISARLSGLLVLALLGLLVLALLGGLTVFLMPLTTGDHEFLTNEAAKDNAKGQGDAQFGATIMTNPLEEKLLANGFERAKGKFLGLGLVKKRMVLQDLCRLLGCRPSDFEHPGSFLFSSPEELEVDEYDAPNQLILHRKQYHCAIWFYDPRFYRPANFPADLSEAEVQVAVTCFGRTHAGDTSGN